jgi:hypothetical protein
MVYFASFNPPVRVSGLIPHLVSRISHPSGTPHHPSRLLKPITHHPLPITHYPLPITASKAHHPSPITHHGATACSGRARVRFFLTRHLEPRDK